MTLDVLLGLLGGALAPVTGGLSLGLTPLAAGAIGSGLGSAIETGNIEQGLKTGLLSYAGGSLLGKLANGVSGAATNVAQNAAQAAPGAVSSPVSNMASFSAANPAASASAINPSAMLKAATTQGIGSIPQAATSAGSGIQNVLGNTANTPNIGVNSVINSAKNFASSPQGIGSLVGTAMAQPIKKKKEDDKDSMSATEMVPIPTNPINPPSTYRPGIDPEWNYGVGTPRSATEIIAYRNAHPRTYAEGGQIDGQDQSAGGIADLMRQPSQQTAPQPNDKQIVSDAIAAIKGQIPDPRIPLAMFVQKFGEDALRSLIDKVQSGAVDDTAARGEGLIDGPGDGQSDTVPAKVSNDGGDVLLSDGEFIVPADVVSGIGNGSSDAGARALDDMLDRVRQERNNTTKQPSPINHRKLMPA